MFWPFLYKWQLEICACRLNTSECQKFCSPNSRIFNFSEFKDLSFSNSTSIQVVGSSEDYHLDVDISKYPNIPFLIYGSNEDKGCIDFSFPDSMIYLYLEHIHAFFKVDKTLSFQCGESNNGYFLANDIKITPKSGNVDDLRTYFSRNMHICIDSTSLNNQPIQCSSPINQIFIDLENTEISRKTYLSTLDMILFNIPDNTTFKFFPWHISFHSFNGSIRHVNIKDATENLIFIANEKIESDLMTSLDINPDPKLLVINYVFIGDFYNLAIEIPISSQFNSHAQIIGNFSTVYTFPENISQFCIHISNDVTQPTQNFSDPLTQSLLFHDENISCTIGTSSCELCLPSISYLNAYFCGSNEDNILSITGDCQMTYPNQKIFINLVTTNSGNNSIFISTSQKLYIFNSAESLLYVFSPFYSGFIVEFENPELVVFNDPPIDPSLSKYCFSKNLNEDTLDYFPECTGDDNAKYRYNISDALVSLMFIAKDEVTVYFGINLTFIIPSGFIFQNSLKFKSKFFSQLTKKQKKINFLSDIKDEEPSAFVNFIGSGREYDNSIILWENPDTNFDPKSENILQINITNIPSESYNHYFYNIRNGEINAPTVAFYTYMSCIRGIKGLTCFSLKSHELISQYDYIKFTSWCIIPHTMDQIKFNSTSFTFSDISPQGLMTMVVAPLSNNFKFLIFKIRTDSDVKFEPDYTNKEKHSILPVTLLFENVSTVNLILSQGWNIVENPQDVNVSSISTLYLYYYESCPNITFNVESIVYYELQPSQTDIQSSTLIFSTTEYMSEEILSTTFDKSLVTTHKRNKPNEGLESYQITVMIIFAGIVLLLLGSIGIIFIIQRIKIRTEIDETEKESLFLDL